MTEAEFATQVEEALDTFGWRWTHFRPARTANGYRTPISGHKGFPDYVAVHKDKQRLLFVELKSDKGTLSPEQKDWIGDLTECSRARVEHGSLVMSYEVYVWRPSDSDTMVETLRW